MPIDHVQRSNASNWKEGTDPRVRDNGVTRSVDTWVDLSLSSELLTKRSSQIVDGSSLNASVNGRCISFNHEYLCVKLSQRTPHSYAVTTWNVPDDTRNGYSTYPFHSQSSRSHRCPSLRRGRRHHDSSATKSDFDTVYPRQGTPHAKLNATHTDPSREAVVTLRWRHRTMEATDGFHIVWMDEVCQLSKRYLIFRNEYQVMPYFRSSD